MAWTEGDSVGPYQVVRLLGRGGMGEVFEAIDVRGGTPVAIKVARHPLDRADDRIRFLDEGRIAATISHPNVVYVLGVEEIHGVPVIVTELMDGGTLRDLLERRGRLAPAEAVDLMRQVTDGLEAVQRAGVLHRDVKPSNCFVDETGRVKVGDFGLAVATRGQASTTGSRRGVEGTVAFASPEQLRGDPLDVRSDIYSAGATLYFLLTGKPPFIGDDATSTIAKVLEDPAPRVRADRPDVARGLDRVVRQCLAKTPADRPRSYADLARLLSPFGATAPTPATLGLRALAFIVDAIIVRGATAAILLAAMQWYQWVPANFFVVGAPHAVLVILYFGGSEALWSASPGKKVFGLRVVRVGMRRLGTGRSFARAGLWMASMLPGLVVVVVAMGSGDLVAVAVRAGLSGYVALAAASSAGILLSFSSVRRRNGFAAWHDLATDTRVVSNVGFAERASHDVGTPAAPIVSDTSVRLGRFVVLDRSAAAGAIVAYDEGLARRVWIREAPPGAAPVSMARRRVSRPARLRWLAGNRDDDRHPWDAYDVPLGHPLRQRYSEPRPWSIVRGWLLDLADEIAASEEDGTHVELGIGRVWVSDATATLLDWEAEPAAADANAATELPPTPQRFLHDVAVIGLGLGTPRSRRKAPVAPLPLHVGAFLDELAAERAGAIADIAARLQALMERPTLVARRRRLVHLATCAAPPLLSVLLFVPMLIVVLPLLARSPDAFVLDACLRRLQQLETVTTTSAAHERAALETYLVGRFRPVLSQPSGAKPWFWLMIDARQRTIQAALQRRPNPSRAEMDRASGALAGLTATAERNRTRAAAGQLGWPLLQAVVLALVALGAMAGLVSSLIVPGGAFLRQIDLAVVGPDGRAATRSRGFARALIAWSPGLAAGLVFMLATRGTPLDNLSLDRLVPSLALLSLFLGGGLFALADPARGLQDRLARTSVVPR